MESSHTKAARDAPLLSHNADSTRRDEERLSPLDLARREHHSDLVALLEGKPVPPRPVIRVVVSV